MPCSPFRESWPLASIRAVILMPWLKLCEISGMTEMCVMSNWPRRGLFAEISRLIPACSQVYKSLILYPVRTSLTLPCLKPKYNHTCPSASGRTPTRSTARSATPFFSAIPSPKPCATRSLCFCSRRARVHGAPRMLRGMIRGGMGNWEALVGGSSNCRARDNR